LFSSAISREMTGVLHPPMDGDIHGGCALAYVG